MSDISIPGVSSSIDTDRMINKLLEAERVPLNRLEDTVVEYRERKTVWQSVGRNLGQLRDSARSLFGFENPFSQRTATSSDASILTATAERGADESTNQIKVLQVAAADRIATDSLPDSFAVPAGRYGFGLGEDEVTFNFPGGTVKEFADAINRRAGDLVAARVVRNTASTQVLMLEGARPGAANPLRFLGESEDLGYAIGMIERSAGSQRMVELTSETVRAEDPEAATISQDAVTVHPESEARISVLPAAQFSGDRIMEVKYRLIHRPIEYQPPAPPVGPSIPDTGDVTIGDITIENLPSDVSLPRWQPPPPPNVVNDRRLLFVESGGRSVPLPELSDSEEVTTLRVPISDLANSADSILLRNRNTHRTLEIESIQFYDPKSRGDYRPINPITLARDAELEMEGIRVTRDSNTINDLIPGAIIELRNADTNSVTLTVEPDREHVKDAIIEFVGYYNQLMREINILTRNDPSVIEEVTYFTDEQRESAEERLGLFQGDSTMNRLKSQLQTVVMNPYRTDAGNQLTLLAQLGISTNASSVASRGIDSSRLRGYLEINETVLDRALATNYESVRQLFGRDTDGDLVVDSGAAYQVDSLVRPYVQVGGVISTRTSTIDTMVGRTETDIEDYKERMDRYEQELRSDFGQMDAALNQMEESQRALQNLNQQNNR